MLNRRNAIKTIGAAAALPLLPFGFSEKKNDPEWFAPAGLDRSPKIMKLACILNKDHQVGSIDLNGTPKEIYDDIQKTLWWPDGNSQGVFDLVVVPKGMTYKTAAKLSKNETKIGNYVFLNAKGLDPLEKCCELEIHLKDRNILKFNRFWVGIYDSNGKCMIGGSVGYPTGYYGREHMKDDKLNVNKYHGAFICPKDHPRMISSPNGKYHHILPPPLPQDLKEQGLSLRTTAYIPG